MSDDWSLNKTGRIPKRKADETFEKNSSYSNIENPVLANSYYNYYNQYGQTQWQQGMAYSQYQGTSPVEPIAQNIYKTLSTIQEKPKNLQRNIFKDTVPDIDDETLPKELTAMFQPLFCKLCSAQLSSNVNAKLHYKSKNHEKKIKKFLIEYAQKTGEPLHKRAKVNTTPKTDEELNPKWFHCDVCDLALTGKQHAESHYMGRNHQKAVMGYKAPAGRGFFNAEGKWVRQAVPKKVILANGADTFGMDFKKKIEETIVSQPAATATISMPNPPTAQQSQYFCDLCTASCTNQEQLEIHYKGNRHQKKLKQMGMAPNVPPTPTSKPASTTDNLSVYRTPSGGYYCPVCNLALNSESQFLLHVKSKAHLKKAAAQKQDK